MQENLLREITRQLKQERFRKRWFSCPSADLFIWHDKGYLVRFEFCYDKAVNEHSVRWQKDIGFSYGRIDNGEDRSNKKSSPILIAGGDIDRDYVFTQFNELSININIDIRRFILDSLTNFTLDDLT